MLSRKQQCTPQNGMTCMQAQAGYSSIELLMVFILIAILTAIAATIYGEYSLRARVSGGIILAAPVKMAVAEYYFNRNTFPVSNSMAGVETPEDISDRDVLSITVAAAPVSGTIIIAFKARGSVAEGDSVLLTPLKYHRTLLWQCTSNTLVQQLLPAACRDE